MLHRCRGAGGVHGGRRVTAVQGMKNKDANESLIWVSFKRVALIRSSSAKCCLYLFCVVKHETVVDISVPLLHRFFGGWAVRGGVTGRPEFIPPYWYLAFFSDGFRIYNTQTEQR